MSAVVCGSVDASKQHCKTMLEAALAEAEASDGGLLDAAFAEAESALLEAAFADAEHETALGH